nr:hypothetical protein [Bacteroidota bacterium]
MNLQRIDALLAILICASFVLFAIGCEKDEEQPNQLPTCVITSPTPGQDVEVEKIAIIRVEANDPDGSIDQVVIIIDGVEMEVAEEAPYEYGWNTTGYALGTYKVIATATDNSGAEKSDEILLHLIQKTGGSCPDMETVDWQGQVYNTVLIGDQCWLKENMNWETGNSLCYDNDPENCNIYGRLYDWETAMNICPDGWHLPTDREWKRLEGFTDSKFGIGDIIWNITDYRGYDAGEHLKTTTGWMNMGNGSDFYGFSGLPAGMQLSPQYFDYKGILGYFWSSTASNVDIVWIRMLGHQTGMSGRKETFVNNFYSARCIRD